MEELWGKSLSWDRATPCQKKGMKIPISSFSKMSIPCWWTAAAAHDPPLKEAGISFNQVTDLILTHFHPDHVGGLPGFLVESWLMGRKNPLHIYGLSHTIDRAETMMGLFDWKKWPNFYPVIFHRLPDQELSLVINSPTLHIYSTPVKHIIPTIGLRISFLQEEKVLAYSGDTEPCPEVVSLAQDADILIHEAAGMSFGHSSAVQAAQDARQAGVSKLYLIHYPRKSQEQAGWLD